MGVHTCDRMYFALFRTGSKLIRSTGRSSKCDIAANFPTFTLSPNLRPGPDPFWDPRNRESNSHRTRRLKSALDEIMRSKLGQRATYLSLTAHSGAIVSVLEAIGHREFRLATGGVLPAVVKVTVKKREDNVLKGDLEEQRNSEVNGTAPRCTVDPTSLPTGL